MTGGGTESDEAGQKARAEPTASDRGMKRDHLQFAIPDAVRQQGLWLAVEYSEEPWEIICLMQDAARDDLC